MKKFIVIYHATPEAMKSMGGDKTPKEMKEGMKPWMDWAEKTGSGLVDLGNPLGNSQKVSDSGATPAGDDVVGYSILQAEDMGGALKLLEGHPHLGWAEGCDITVHEAMPLPGQ